MKTNIVLFLMTLAVLSVVFGGKLIEIRSYDEIEMNVSAYCKESCCCGQWADGITASGEPAQGLLIAAPSNYPFGTRMCVDGYGTALVLDRGGAITGNKIDLLFPSHEAALEWGRKTIMVKVYRKG